MKFRPREPQDPGMAMLERAAHLHRAPLGLCAVFFEGRLLLEAVGHEELQQRIDAA